MVGTDVKKHLLKDARKGVPSQVWELCERIKAAKAAKLTKEGEADKVNRKIKAMKLGLKKLENTIGQHSGGCTKLPDYLKSDRYSDVLVERHSEMTSHLKKFQKHHCILHKDLLVHVRLGKSLEKLSTAQLSAGQSFA